MNRFVLHRFLEARVQYSTAACPGYFNGYNSLDEGACIEETALRCTFLTVVGSVASLLGGPNEVEDIVRGVVLASYINLPVNINSPHFPTSGLADGMVKDGIGALFIRNEGGLLEWGDRLMGLVPLDALQAQVFGRDCSLSHLYNIYCVDGNLHHIAGPMLSLFPRQPRIDLAQLQ